VKEEEEEMFELAALSHIYSYSSFSFLLEGLWKVPREHSSRITIFINLLLRWLAVYKLGMAQFVVVDCRHLPIREYHKNSKMYVHVDRYDWV